MPLPLQRRSSDEYLPAAWGPRDRRALAHYADGVRARGTRVDGNATRRATAAGLLAINAAWEGDYYDVPPEAARDGDAADAAFAGDELVIDVQTHYVARERAGEAAARAILAFIRSIAPDRWRGLRGEELSLVPYLRHVFLESETAVAVLTSAPGEGRDNILTSDEIAATRALCDRLGGSGRLLHHAIVHPNLPGELDALADAVARRRPDGLKVYTLYGRPGAPAWRLDDEPVGRPFLARASALGVRRICAHKGLSALAPTGSPADVGPAAAAFPELDFLVYHAGYEITQPGREEGPYDAAAPRGTDRLVRSLADAGVRPGANVYAEIGSTWFALLRRPREAAHVLGKLLRAVGEDRVLWGTDSIWYGSPQPLVDAFRAFRIPPALSEAHGYPALSRRVKEKILGLNAARAYGLDPAGVRARTAHDDVAWVRSAVREAARGTPGGA